MNNKKKVSEAIKRLKVLVPCGSVIIGIGSCTEELGHPCEYCRLTAIVEAAR